QDAPDLAVVRDRERSTRPECLGAAAVKDPTLRQRYTWAKPHPPRVPRRQHNCCHRRPEIPLPWRFHRPCLTALALAARFTSGIRIAAADTDPATRIPLPRIRQTSPPRRRVSD